MLAGKSLIDFAAQLSSTAPVPGGGTVSALCGYLSAALALKVCYLTLGKEQYKESHAEMHKVGGEIEELKAELLGLMDEDAGAFAGVINAYRLPRRDPCEVNKRKEAIKQETLKAALVPLRTAEKCLQLLKKIPVVIDKGVPSAVSDAGVAAHLAAAGLEGALLNVAINIKGINKEYALELEQRIARINEAKQDLMSHLLRTLKKG